jgi:hypothetical protein
MQNNTTIKPLNQNKMETIQLVRKKLAMDAIIYVLKLN